MEQHGFCYYGAALEHTALTPTMNTAPTTTIRSADFSAHHHTEAAHVAECFHLLSQFCAVQGANGPKRFT